ncbi:MAG: aminotransferase class I/II-fold pyridoxal phosphate-dependent enzyme [Chloroflexota bacterium]
MKKKFASRIGAQSNVHWLTVHKLIAAKQAEGVDVIQLSSGNPDTPTPRAIVETMREAVLDPTYHRYPFSFRTDLNQAIASWYQNRFGVTLNPQNEIYPLAGSQMALGNLGLAIMEPGTTAVMTDPAYGSYERATKFAGGDCHILPISAAGGYLPDLNAIPTDVLAKTRLIWLNYPNNPTGAIAPLSFFEEVVAFAKKHDIIVCHDNAYSEILFDGYVAPSFLAVEGAKEVGVEVNTMSKAFNMAGWRVGMVVGNAEVLAAMGQVQRNTSMGLFGPVQLAAIEALTGDQGWLAERNQMYQERRDIVVAGLKAAGFEVESPKATLYVWAKLPPGHTDSLAFSKWLLDKAGVWISAGSFFGSGGKEYVRATLTVPTERLKIAMERLKQLDL